MNINKPITGSLNGSYWSDTGYRSLWCNMLKMSIDHSMGRNLNTMGSYSQEFIKTEIHLSRCHVLSNLFEQDCYFIGWGDDLIKDIRAKCKKHWHVKGCVVCGRGNDEICWEHQRVIEAFNEGRDIGYRFSDEKEVEQYELQIIKREDAIRDTVKIREITRAELQEIYA
jgi:hypothetical protein